MSAESQARAIVNALLGGHLVTEQHASQLHVMRIESPVLPLRASPATAVSSVVIDGGTIDSDAYSFTPFCLVREDGEAWPCGSITVTYSTGWDAGSEPAAIQEALAIIEARLTARPDDSVRSEAADDIKVVYAATTSGVTASERALLAPWIRA